MQVKMVVTMQTSLGIWNEEFWKKLICNRITKACKQAWKNGCNDTEREKEYVQMKECPRNESLQMEIWGQE